MSSWFRTRTAFAARLTFASPISCRARSLRVEIMQFDRMRRRSFIMLLGGAAAWPLASRAQQAKVPVIGFLGTTSASVWSLPVAAFEQRLGELGWIVNIDYRWTDGRNEQAPQIAEAFVRRSVDVIVVGGNGLMAVKQATATIPIVFPVAVDPVGSGFVHNLSQPGGNVTGLSLQSPDAAAKRLELLSKVVPSLRRLAIMVNVGYPATRNELDECQTAARALGIDVSLIALRRAEDIAAGFEALGGGRTDALYVVAEALANTHHAEIARRALDARLPTMFGTSDIIRQGGLMAYGPSLPALFRRAADYVDKILRGTKPGDIPVEQPTTFVFAVNLATARALGLAFPPTVLALADEVVE
jgi:putative ABC transport system substrate-binding protein